MLLALGAPRGQAVEVELNPTSANENFDSMGSSGTASLPSGWVMSAAGTAAPTYAAAGNLTAVSQQASTGAPSTGGRYNWGSSASERAAGFMTSGGYASPNSIMVGYVNNAASAISGVTLAFDYERYRINTAAAAVTFFYSTDGSSWTAVSAGDSGAFTTGASAYGWPLSTINKSGISITGLNVATGGKLYFRWNFNTTGSNSQGLGLDNVSLSVTYATPTLTADNTGNPTASTVYRGDTTKTIYAVRLTAGGSAASFTAITLARTLGNGANPGDFLNYKLWYDADGVGAIAPVQLSTTQADGDTLVFGGIAGQTIAVGTPCIYYVTADVNAAATIGGTVNLRLAANSDTDSDLTSGTAPYPASPVDHTVGSVANDLTLASAGGESATLSSVGNAAVIDTTGDGAQAWQFTLANAAGNAGEATVTALTLTQGAANEPADWTQTLRVARLFDGGTALGSAGTPAAGSVAFTGLNVVIADGASKTLTLRVSLQDTATLTDGQNLEFKLAGSDVAVTGNGVTTAAADSDEAQNAIDVAATRLVFSSVPSTATVAVNFSATVQARDANGNVDLDNTASVTLTKATGSGTLTGGAAQSLVSGAGTWATLQVNAADTYTLQAAGGGLTDGVSGSITVTQLLQAGDIVFAAFNADGNDDIAFAAFADIPAGTVLYFRDDEWGGAAFTAGEGWLTWTAPGAPIAAGTVVVINNGATVPTTTHGAVAKSGSFNLGGSGDGLFCYRGADAATPAAFLAAVGNDVVGTAFGTLSGTGLTAGDTAVLLTAGTDIGQYTGARAGDTRTGYRARLNSMANWALQDAAGDQSSDATPPDLPFDTTAFTFAAPAAEPTLQAADVQFANVSGTQMDVQWTNGDGAGRLVICRQGSAPSAGPIDGIAYAADADFGGAGSALGGGKVVFAGAGSSFTLTGLALSTTYYLQVYEYNGTGGTLNYLTAGGVNNPNSQATTAAADGAGTAVLSSLTPGPLSGSALFQRAQAGQTVAITVTGPAAGSLASVSVAVPAAWAGLLAGNVTLAGAGFGGASAGVAGNTVTVTGAAVTDANPGEIRLAGLTARDVTLAADGGTDTWTVQSQAVGGTALVALAAGSPVSRVTVPLSLLRAVDGSGVPVRNGETVAVEGVVSAVNGAFSLAYTSAFIQDGAAGVNIYNAAVWDVLRTAGQRAVVLGAVSVYRGLTELVPASAGHIYDLGADAAVAATPRTLAALLAGAELYESTLVRVANLRIVSGTWPATAGSDADLTVSDDLGVTTIVLHIDADTDIDGNAAPPEPFALTGLVSQYAGFAAPYSGGYQLIPRGFGDVGEVTQGTVFSFR